MKKGDFMSSSRPDTRGQSTRRARSGKVVHIYQVRPELALEHLKRTTGLDFDGLPESLVHELSGRADQGVAAPADPPILTDVVEHY